MLSNLKPVTPRDLNLEQLIGCRVKMIYARPSYQSPMIEECTVLDFKTSKRGEFQMLVKPNASHLPAKWRSDMDFLGYIKTEVVATNIA